MGPKGRRPGSESSGDPVGFGTAAVHAGEPRKKEGNALTTPIMQTATYTFADTQELRDHFEHRIDREAVSYTHLTLPTNREV